MFWQGDTIKQLPPNSILIFGSNPQGRHGAGLALFARKYYGAKYGQGRGLQGSSYGLITKNLQAGYTEYLTNGKTIRYNKQGYNSIRLSQLSDNITEMLEVIKSDTKNNYYLPYMLGDKNLNGYSSLQIFKIILRKELPSNLVIHESFKNYL